METLETSKTIDEAYVMSKLGQAQNLCGETLEGASGFSSDKFSELVSASEVSATENGGVNDASTKHKESKNVEVGNQFLNARKILEDVEGEILVAGLVGVVSSGNNCLDVGGTETVTLMNEAVAEGNQMTVCGTQTVTLVVGEAFAEGNQMKGDSLEPDSEGKRLTVPYNSEMGNEYGLVWKMCSTGSGNEEEVGVEKVVMQEGVEEGDASQLNLVDVGNKVEVSGKGISLYVEVFGPLDGLNQGADSNSLSGRGLFGSNLNEENLWKGKDAMLPDIRGSISEVQDCSLDENSGGNDVEGNVVDNPGYRFNVGDFAWAKTKMQSWWPALICEPSDASKDAVKTERGNGHLVRYFGSGSLFWCLPSQLKPFNGYFEQMSRQNNSKSFLCAVEKAVHELGRCVKLEMTCPCFPESRNTDVVKEGGKMSVEKECKLGDFPLIMFEPANLLSRIKYFATDVSVPGMIEFTVIQNRLSAFYRSIGHHQLAVHQLKPTTDAKSNAQDGLTSGVFSSNLESKSRNRPSKKDPKDGSDEAVCTKMASPSITSNSSENKVAGVENNHGGTGKSEKGNESRERRKSKYLSFPYVDLSRGHKNSTNLEENEIKDQMAVSHARVDKKSTDVQSMGSTPVIKSSGKKSRKRWPKKPITGHDISDKPEAINVSSTEMLSELRFTALDRLYPDESTHFNVVKKFFSRFRRLAFRDFTCEIANEDTVGLEFDNEMHLPQTLPEIEVQIDKKMEKGGVTVEHCSTKLAAGATDVNKTAESSSAGKCPKGKSKQKERKKKEKTTQLGSNTGPTGVVVENITTSGPVILDFQKIDPHASESQSVSKKRKKKAGKTPGIPQIKVMAGLPDLNGSSGFRLEGWNVAGAAAPHEGKSEPKRKEATSANCSLTNGVTVLPDVNGSIGKIGTVLKDVEVTGLHSLQNIPELNNDGTRQDVSLHLNAERTANPPYVNKTAEPSSVMRDTKQMGMLSPCGKPELKKRKRKQKDPDCRTNVISAIPDLNGNASEPRLQGNQLPEMNCIPPEGKPQRKRRRKKAAAGLLDINLSYGEAQTNGEALGTALLLKFASELPMPTKENLVSTFCAFGALKESETQVLNDSGSAHVVFTSSSDARNAFRSLEKSSPFGPALVNYRLQILLAASGASDADGNLNMQQAWPADKVKSPSRRRSSKKPKTPGGKPSGLKPRRGEGREAPDLQFVKQNLQVMTSMLENAGNNLSAEMRAKLESEIKSLLKKVSSMVGSSSSS